MKINFIHKTATQRAITSVLASGLIALSLFNIALAKTPPASAKIGSININEGFSPLVTAVKPSVVNIATTTKVKSRTQHFPNFGQRNGQEYGGELDEFLRRFFGDQFHFPDSESMPRQRESRAVGSGFIISEDGFVVTNHHVIDGADEIEVVFQDGKRYPAKVKGSDKKADIALVEIDTDHPLPYVAFGNSDETEIGDWVVAIGNPFGLGGTVTAGIVSARGRDINSGPYDDFIQIDAPINRGNSGGPLFNIKGEVVGVNSAIYSPSGGSVGIGFSIPSNMVQNIVEQLKTTGHVERGWLGVQIQHVSEEIADSLGLEDASGALVADVVADSPAERAGFQAGDVILTFDGEKVEEMRDLPRMVAQIRSGSTVQATVWRNETRRTLSVQISDTDEQPETASSHSSPVEKSLGLVISPITPELRTQHSIDEKTSGVVVTDMDPESEAASRGVRVGDVIKKVGRQAVSSVSEAKQAITTAEQSGRDSVLLLIDRESQVLFVAVPLK